LLKRDVTYLFLSYTYAAIYTVYGVNHSAIQLQREKGDR